MTNQPRRTLSAVDPDVEVFDARAEADAAETNYPPFPFIGMDGKIYHLPHPLMLRAGEQTTIIQAQAAGDANAAELALRALLTDKAPEAMAAMDQMPSVVVGRLMVTWQARSAEGVESLGEALGGSSPPNRAARRSKRTSPSGASTSGA